MIAVLGFASVAHTAEHSAANYLRLSGRLGWNLSARFSDLSGAAAVAPPRTTPDGAAYNYDDGYVLTDISGNAGSQTWNWGYDDSARQIVGNTIEFSRAGLDAAGLASPANVNAPSWGAELVYGRLLGKPGRARIGIEVAANYLDLDLRDSGTYSGNLASQVDAYPFTPGTTPPLSPDPVTGQPFQGSYAGPNFVIGDTPTSLAPASRITHVNTLGRRRYEAILWGFRLGPVLDVPLSRRLHFAAAGGLAVGVLDGTMSWTGTPSAPGGGRNQDTAVLWGWTATANLSWRLSERWRLGAGAQYQYLGRYEHTANAQKFELDLRDSIFVTFGLGCVF